MRDRLLHKRILITGSTGFLGSYLVRYLHHFGFSHLLCGKRPTSRTGLLNGMENDIEWLDWDLTCYEDVEDAVQRADIIFHCAALITFHRSMYREMNKVNISATRNLVNLALEYGIEKFIHISSISALGRSKDERHISEDTQFRFTRLDSHYATSKFLSEMEVWRAQSEGLPVAVLNPGLIMGSGYWDQGTCRIFRRVYDGLPYYPAGSTGFVDVRDVARMAIMLLEDGIEAERMICIARNASHKEILDLISKYLGKTQPKFRLSKFLHSLAPVLEAVLAGLQGKEPLATRESLRISRHRFTFDNSKSIEKLGFRYIPMEQTLRETGSQFVQAAKQNWLPRVLPIVE